MDALPESHNNEFIRCCSNRIEELHQEASFANEARQLKELVQYLWKQEDWDSCIKYCKLWLSRIPPIPNRGNFGAYIPTFLSGKSCFNKGNLAAAEEHWRDAINICHQMSGGDLHWMKPNSLIQSFSCCYQILVKQERYDEALDEIASIKQLTVGADMHGHLFTLLAHLRLKQGDPLEALRQIDEAMLHWERAIHSDKFPTLKNQALRLRQTIIDTLNDGEPRSSAGE